MNMQLNPKRMVEKQYIKLADKSKVCLIGIDLTVDRDIVFNAKEHTHLIRLQEEFCLPRNVFAILYPRSTLFRMGFIIQCGVIEPGYHGRPVILIHYSGREPISVKLDKGTRVVQAVFYRAESEGMYSGKYQGEGLE